MGTSDPVHLSDGEWQLMQIVWRQGSATAREVLEALPEENTWAYSTVKTMLDRLVEKDIIQSEKRGNVSFYEPVVSQNQARRNAVRSFLDKAFDGAFAPLMRFLLQDGSLSEADRNEIRKLLNDELKNGGSGEDRG